MGRIEVFADIVCPFTYVGLRRFVDERGARAGEVAFRVRAWPLEWINGAPLAPDLAEREVEALREQIAPDLFAGFEATAFPTTSIPAFGLADAAYAIDDATGQAVSLALREAVFEMGADLADDDTLRRIGRRFGVEPRELAEAEAVTRADWELGQARGVQGSPHFFVGDRDWFCPSMNVAHVGHRFDVQVAGETMRDFYAAALG